jgi:hypothetical protein
LILISVLGAGISWLWLLFVLWLDNYRHDYWPVIWAAVFAPGAIGAIVLSGALAGLIYILWLLTAGNGLNNSLLASAAGVMVALAHLVVSPAAAAFTAVAAVELAGDGSFHGPDIASHLVAPVMALVLIAAFALMLQLTERWPISRPFALIIAPLLVPLGAVLFILLELWSIRGRWVEHLTFEYTFLWRAFCLVNPMVSLPPFFYGSWDMRALDEIPTLWYGYPLLIISQLALAALALNYARRAARLRRGNFT